MTAGVRPAVWQVEVTSRCVGSGMCIATAPQYFQLLQGYSNPRAHLVAESDDVLAAAELCPMNAIRIRDTRTGDDVA